MDVSVSEEGPPESPRRTRRWRRIALVTLAAAGVYVLAAYVLMPFDWRRYVRRHPGLDDVPGITLTGSGIPGDPLNVALVGTEDQVKKIMLAAGWFPADGLTFRSCLKIAEASVLGRPYTDAPVSNLYLFGRREDLAFEQPVGHSPRRRHHVRFWRTGMPDADGRPVWVGSASYDISVGLSHTTGQITHHIAPDVDAERDHLMEDLRRTGDVAQVDVIGGFHSVCQGRNGGGDPWRTDGAMDVAVIATK